MDTLNDENPIPPLIDVGSLVSKRLKQISDLVDVIHNGGRDHNPKTVVQRLPRHMRRRAMSHNVKRLPRRHRGFAVRVISKTNHRTKAPSRLRRRRPNNLQKEYERRGLGQTRWLSTHLWHAKRFEMINLWGFKLPLRCFQRGVRPLIRKLKDGALMFDDSYFRLLRLRFFSLDRAAAFEVQFAQLKSQTFQPIFGSRVSACGVQKIFTFKNESGGHNDVILSVHPLYFERPVELLSALCGCNVEKVKSEIKNELNDEYGSRVPIDLFNGDDCRITDETNLYSFFTFYGHEVTRKLGSSIKLTTNDENSEFANIHDKWKQFSDSNGTPESLPNGTTFSLLAQDPRLYSSFSRLTISSTPAPTSSPVLDGDQWVRGLDQSALLFDSRELNCFAEASISEKRLNDLKSSQLAAIKLRRYRVPILISTWNWCSSSKTTILLPSFAARHFFLNFQRAGLRVGSISDRFLLCNELSDCMYPFHWLPLTTETKLYRWKRYRRFPAVDLSAFGRWSQLTNWTHVLDNPKRLANLQTLLDRPDLPLDEIQFENTKNVLIPVRLVVDGRGDVTDNDFIYDQVGTSNLRTNENKQEKTPSKTGGLLREYKTVESVDVSAMFDSSKPRVRKPKTKHEVNEQELSRIVGRVVYSTSSLLFGRVEALGFVDLSLFPKLRTSRGRVEVRKPGGQKFTSAVVRMLFC